MESALSNASRIHAISPRKPLWVLNVEATFAIWAAPGARKILARTHAETWRRLKGQPYDEFSNAAVIGSGFAYWAHVRDGGGLPPDIPRPSEVSINEMVDGFAKYLATAIARPLPKAAEVLSGFAYGVRKAAKKDASGLLNSFTMERRPILEALHKNWQYIEIELVQKRKRLPDLHQWLCGRLGQNTVGTLKRLEKICSDIDLRFPPGRPRVTEKSEASQESRR